MSSERQRKLTKAEAIAHFGSGNKLAAALGIHASAVSRWITIPPLRQYQIRELMEGGGERICNEGTQPATIR